MEKNFFSFLNETTPVKLVANTKMDGNPLVTPLMDAKGNPKTDLLGNPLGSIRLEQQVRSMNGTYLNERNRVSFIAGTLDSLNALVAVKKLENGSEVPGKIVIKESIRPMWDGQKPKINPQTDEEIGVTVGNAFYPVYMKMYYTENMNEKDSLVRTADDVAGIIQTEELLKAAANEAKAETASVPNS